MFTHFTLLFAAGVGSRLVASWALRRTTEVTISVPQALAVVLLVLAMLPSWLQPVPYPLPFSLTLGLLLPDLVLSRRWS